MFSLKMKCVCVCGGGAALAKYIFPLLFMDVLLQSVGFSATMAERENNVFFCESRRHFYSSSWNRCRSDVAIVCAREREEGFFCGNHSNVWRDRKVLYPGISSKCNPSDYMKITQTLYYNARK